MRKVHLIREFAPDAYEFALASWSWVGTGGKTPRFASCFGDMFLESPEGWWFLDTVEGTLERCWDSMDAMFTDLEGSDGRADYLLEDTLNAALDQGLRLADDEVFAFLPPPAVTGTMSVDSLAPLRFAIAANLAGRIHGELNGVQPDAGASALFAAQQSGTQPAAATDGHTTNEAAQHLAGTRGFDAPNPQTDRWEPAAQRVSTGAYPAYQPAPLPGYADTEYAGTRYSAAEHSAGSELDHRSSDHGSGHPQGYGASTSAPTAAAVAPATRAVLPGVHGGGPAPAQYGQHGYDYADSSHTTDSSQFSQHIADQYNTGQVAAVGYEAAVPARPQPHQDGRWSYA